MLDDDANRLKRKADDWAQQRYNQFIYVITLTQFCGMSVRIINTLRDYL